MSTILIVDDEPSILKTVRAYLENEGFTVHTASEGQAALQAARAYRPALIVLDVMLPGMDGFEVLRRLRQESEVYVLMLTAKADEVDRIVGLTMGADDYLVKPFSPRELVARVKAILRRERSTEPGSPALQFTHIRIDADARQAWKDDELLDLTPTEFDLLHVFARHPGLVLSREQLIEQVWGHDYYGDERLVDVHIRRLRKKLNDDPVQSEVIATVRGAGYRFEDTSV